MINLEQLTQEAGANPVGARMIAEGYHVAHTGGGCLVWEKKHGETVLWICDEGNGLGDKLDELYLVGHYNADGEDLADGSVDSLQEAIDWVNARMTA